MLSRRSMMRASTERHRRPAPALIEFDVCVYIYCCIPIYVYVYMYGVAYLNMSRTRALTYVYTHAHPWACDLEFSSWSKDMWRGLKSIVIVMVSAVYLMRIPKALGTDLRAHLRPFTF